MLILIQMSRRWFLILIFVTALSGCTGKDANSEEAAVLISATPTPVLTTAKTFPVAEPLTVYVNIKGTMFSPLELNITNGTTVRWTNLDSSKYVVNVTGSQSHILNKKDTWNYTFNKPGTYEYGCDLYPSMPRGRITVT